MAQFEPHEAEFILRDGWDDAEMVGGFRNDWTRTQKLNELQEMYGDQLQGYRMIGHTSFWSYDGAADYFLFVRESDDLLMALNMSYYLSEDEFYYAVTPLDQLVDVTDIEDWLDTVSICAVASASY